MSKEESMNLEIRAVMICRELGLDLGDAYNGAISAKHSDTDKIYLLGDIHDDLFCETGNIRNLVAAKNCMKKVLEFNPEHTKAKMHIDEMYGELTEILEKTVEENPLDNESKLQLGLAYYERANLRKDEKELQKAIGFLRQYSDENPFDARALCPLNEFYRNSGDKLDSSLILTRIGDSFAHASQRFDNPYKKAELIESALNNFKQALELNPDNEECIAKIGLAHYALFYLKKDSSHLKPAVENLERYSTNNPSDEWSIHALIALYNQLGDDKKVGEMEGRLSVAQFVIKLNGKR